MNQVSLTEYKIFKRILKESKDAIYVQDLDTRVLVWANDIFNELHQVSDFDEIRGRKIGSIFVQEGELLASTISDESKPKSIRLEVSHHGKTIPVQFTVGIFENKYIYGIIQDISEFVELHSVLENVTNQNREFLKSINSGVIIAESNGNILYLNQFLAKMLGYELKNEIKVNNILDLIYSDDLEDIKTQISENVDMGSFAHHIRVRCADSTLKEVILSLGSLKTPHGNHWGVLAVFSDITEKMLLEKLRNRFIEVTTHELRTPLTVIRGCTYLLNKAKENDDYGKKILNTLTRNVHRLEKLITDVYTLSEIEKGIFSVNKRPVTFKEFKTALLDDLKTWNYSSRIVPDICIDPSLKSTFPLVFDFDRLSQAIFNLLENACKHSPGDMPVVLIIKWQTKGLNITVQDHGEGIPSEIISKVYSPFISRVTSYSAGGLGLGLTITKGIVDQHGGNIFIDATKNEGSKVRILIPPG
ncbi:MAG: ATP-binding protein [Promethearchaeota archaeon]